MPVVTCSNCLSRIQVKTQVVGTWANCPKCGESIQLDEDNKDESTTVPLPRLPAPGKDTDPDEPRRRKAHKKSGRGSLFRILAVVQLLLGGLFLLNSQSEGVANIQASLFCVGAFLGAQLCAVGAAIASLGTNLSSAE